MNSVYSLPKMIEYEQARLGPTMIVNLAHPVLRKGHLYNIKQVEKDPDFRTTVSNSLYSHDEYVKLHHLCSGRVTRPQRSFDIQYELLRSGNATIVGLMWRSEIAGLSYFIHDKACPVVLYLSAADNPAFRDTKKVPVHHVIVWEAMKYFKGLGYKAMDLGRPCDVNALDHKERNIAIFKEGFGAEVTNIYE